MPVTAVNVFKDEIMAEEDLIRDGASMGGCQGRRLVSGAEIG